MANQLAPRSSSMEETVFAGLACAGCGAAVFSGDAKDGVEVRAAAAGGLAGVAGVCGTGEGTITFGEVATGAGFSVGSSGGAGGGAGAVGLGSTGKEGGARAAGFGGAGGSGCAGVGGTAGGADAGSGVRVRGTTGLGASEPGTGAGADGAETGGGAETGFSAVGCAGAAGAGAPAASLTCNSPMARCNFKRSRTASSACSFNWWRNFACLTERTMSQTGATSSTAP